MTPLDTAVGQVSITGGTRQAWAPNARAIEPMVTDRLGQRKGHLYILTEIMGSHASPQVLYRQIVNVIQRVYYEAPSSVTAALQSAITEAHLLLQDAGVMGGVSCVVLRDGDIYIAQVAPTLVVIASPEIVQLFPSSPESTEQPLGGRGRPEIALFHAPVAIPTTVVLGESRWLAQAEPRMLAGAATAPNVSAVLDVLAKLAGRSDLSAMVVGVGVEAEGVVPAGLEEELEPVPPPRETPRRRERTAPKERRVETKAVPPVAPPQAERRVAETPSKTARSEVPSRPSLGARARRLAQRAVPEETKEAAPAERRREPARPRPRGQSSRWPVLIAVLIPVVVALVAAGLWWQRGWQRDRRFDELLQGARAALDSARGVAADETLARVQLEEGQQLIEEALTLKSDNPEADGVRMEIQRSLNEINRVVPLPMLMPLVDFSQEGRDLGRVLVEGLNVFVLDRGNDSVRQYELNADLRDIAQPVGEGPVLQKGQQVEQTVVSELADITWLSTAGAQEWAGLLTLDQSGGLFLGGGGATGQATNLPLQLPPNWRFPQSIETYEGYFYVLEPSLNQIFRYQPGTEGYDQQPTTYFGNDSLVNLAGVVDLSISGQACGGNVYLLYRNGVLNKYTRGVPEPFEVIMPDEPLQDTPAFFSTDGDCHLFVSDAANGRIVELEADGSFLFQYKLLEGDALHALRSLYVDDADGSFYILTNDALYRTPIPR